MRSSRITLLLAGGLLLGSTGCLYVRADPEVARMIIEELRDEGWDTDDWDDDEEELHVEFVEDDAPVRTSDDPRTARIRELERMLRENGRSLELATALLRLADQEARLAEATQEVELEIVEAELVLARTDMEAFQDHEQPLALERARLELDAQGSGYQDAQAELSRLERIVADDESGEEDAVFELARGQRFLELEAAHVRMQEAELEALREVELPRRSEEVQQAVRLAERRIDLARLRYEITREKARIERTERELEVRSLEEERQAISEQLELLGAESP